MEGATNRHPRDLCEEPSHLTRGPITGLVVGIQTPNFPAMLPALFALHLTLQGTPPQRPAAVVRDSAPADSLKRDIPRRLPVTAAVLATAFHDSTARHLYARARATHMAQDSAIMSYDAKVRQRMSVFASIGRLGRPRLAYRTESAARVRWQRGVGAHIDITGARSASPIIGSKEFDKTAIEGELDESGMSPIPYFPGSETLWAGGLSARTEVDERIIVNPLATGAEAYYTYRTGDSVTFRLPDGRMVRLRELDVRPRQAMWNATVGSLWFDTETGQLVRAAYRLAGQAGAKVGVSVNAEDSTNKAAKLATFFMNAIISPTKAEISSVVIEYGLYEGRFWLPRQQSMEGFIQASFAHVPMQYENSFSYSAVNGPMTLAAITPDTARRQWLGRGSVPPEGLDSAARRQWRDSTRILFQAEQKARQDSITKGMRVGTFRQCDFGPTRTVTRYRAESRVQVQMVIPCSLDSLANSPDFTGSIYGSGEDVFGSEDRQRLIGEALSMAAQAPLGSLLPKARWQYGTSMTRYNRVEGFSTGLAVEQQLGGGLFLGAQARIGGADLSPNAELTVARTNMTKTRRITGYKRLVSAGDWGNPLGFGSSVSAFLYGRDEGFYYRATGVELVGSRNQSAGFEWRAFAERQRTATPEATFSLGATFTPNIVAATDNLVGLAVRSIKAFGLNPRGLRAFTDLRLEAATGDSSYGRGALDLTLSRDLLAGLAAAITVSGGTSAGSVPVQRLWYLGGTHTVRGLKPDTSYSGNAFWLGRAELARQLPGVRFSLFGDFGWAGDRTKMSEVGRPLSGAGIGVSGLDGLIRLDVARGIHPTKQTRVNLYLDARF
jgi:hypothetical protein